MWAYILLLVLLLGVLGLLLYLAIHGITNSGPSGASGAGGSGICGITGISWVYTPGGGTATSTIEWKGGAAAGTVTLTSTPVVSTTGNAGKISTTTALPVAIRPNHTYLQAVQVEDNGTAGTSAGALQVATTGILTITKDFAGGAFTGGGAATGAQGNMSVTYQLPP